MGKGLKQRGTEASRAYIRLGKNLGRLNMDEEICCVSAEIGAEFDEAILGMQEEIWEEGLQYKENRKKFGDDGVRKQSRFYYNMLELEKLEWKGNY